MDKVEPAATGVVGRFAPSPTGPLHAGSLVAALASWLDARAQRGRWLVRIEDVDTTRCLPGMDRTILQQLAACGMHSDGPVLTQSSRSASYQQALDTLTAKGLAYPCGCSRQDIALTHSTSGVVKPRHGELVYPGTCRTGLHGKLPRAWRLNIENCMKNHALAHVFIGNSAAYSIAKYPPRALAWQDRRLGWQHQDVAMEVGDFVLKRADGCFAYQLAVVVDDAAQGITDVVRGEDLANNTARQILLQQALGLPGLRHLHTPLVLGANGEKLSKQNGAQAFDVSQPMLALNHAAQVLGLSTQTGDVPQALGVWVSQWAHLYNPPP